MTSSRITRWVLFVSFLILVLLVAAIPGQAANNWGVGSTVGLCKDSPIRTGSGLNYDIHTYVPENGWEVVVKDGPRSADGHTWWDIDRGATGDPAGGTGWVIQSENEDCPVDGGGGNDGGGSDGGGGNDGGGDNDGGGGDFICEVKRYITMDPDDQLSGGPAWEAALPVNPNFHTIWEGGYGWDVEGGTQWTASAAGWVCDGVFRLDIGDGQFGIEDSKGNSFEFNDTLSDVNITDEDAFYSNSTTNIGIGRGIAREHNAAWVGPTIEGTYKLPLKLSVELGHQFRALFRVSADEVEARVLKVVAVIGTVVVIAFVIDKVIAAAGAALAFQKLAYITMAVVAYMSSVFGVDIGTTTSATSFAYPETFHMAAVYNASIYHTAQVPALASPVVKDMMGQNYGPVADFITVGTVHSDRNVVSAYTTFSYEAYGFTPDSTVYVEFGLPEQEALLTDVVAANESGVIRGTLEMPAPDIPLGDYLISALDTASLDYSLGQIMQGNSTELTGYGAGAIVEVVDDVTPPAITIASPEARVYTRCEMPPVDFAVTDDLSGVDWTTALLDGESVANGDTIDMLFWNLGDHALYVEAADKVGNQAEEAVTFQLQATIAGMQCALDRFYEDGLVDGHGTYNALGQQLTAAQAALMRGQPRTAANILSAFEKHVDAQTGKKIDPSAGAILAMDSDALVSEYRGR